jgi:hypothetical protein
MYVIVWQFQAAPGREEAFEQAYGPGGDWARFFGRSLDFRGTELLRAALEQPEDAEQDTPSPSGDYFTIDRWDTLDAYVAFNERFASEYEELDNRFLELCSSEVCLGKFVTVD